VPGTRILVLLASSIAASALALVSVSVAVGGAGVPVCRGGDLSGSFTVVRGSAGAGNISYTLRIRNRSGHECFVSGLPGLRLLGRSGRALPTHVVAAHPGELTAVRVVLRPGSYAAATARFSPDVPGVGESRPCERTAYRVRVTPPPGGGTFVAPVSPPTLVCEHGRMTMSVLVAGRTGPRSP
jgi:hypothetical protein